MDISGYDAPDAGGSGSHVVGLKVRVSGGACDIEGMYCECIYERTIKTFAVYIVRPVSPRWKEAGQQAVERRLQPMGA